MKASIVSTDHITEDNATVIRLFGRLENDQSFVALLPHKPHFFLSKEDEPLLPKLPKSKTSPTKFKTFQNEEVIKVTTKNQTDLTNLIKTLHEEKIHTYEADIKPPQRFLIDNDIKTTIEIEGNYETAEKIDRVYQNPEITTSDHTPNMQVASIDIESDKDSGALICIGIYTEKTKKVFMVTEHKLKNTEAFPDEASCIEAFRSALEKEDPDILTGWNFIDFDLQYLKAAFAKHKIPYDLGRTNDPGRLRIQANFFKTSSATFPGRQVIDALSLIRDPFLKEAPTIKKANFESYTLENVSQEILGEGKLLKSKDRHNKIDSLYTTNTKSSHQELADYNLQDCKLVYDILEKTQTLNLALERTHLTGVTLNKLTASIAAFDSLYIREARRRNLVSPSSHYTRKDERITGGYVQNPDPGIYHNVLVLDFKSLYPSVLRTFNIDPSSLREKKSKTTLELEDVHYENTSGILPEIIEKLHAAREEAKKQKKELASYAIKTIMNSFWGVLASPNCRYFNFDMANSITKTAQATIKLTAKEIEKLGHEVIYSDTDSVFVHAGSKLKKEEAQALGKEIEQHINAFYQNHIKKNYKRTSHLELEFEKLYTAFMTPQVRGKKSGAKKRYAGLVNNKLEITGLEAVRGDWTEAAQSFQKQLLMKVFTNISPTTYIKQTVAALKAGKLNDKLIYRKSLRKPLEEYTKTTPPHVKAARKLPELETNIIEYVVTTDGPEPISQQQHSLDYDHYLDKQFKPIATQVLELLDQDFDDVITGSKQATLF
jgi:DNA polymerase-2